MQLRGNKLHLLLGAAEICQLWATMRTTFAEMHLLTDDNCESGTSYI
jgi:hypothetical protein